MGTTAQLSEPGGLAVGPDGECKGGHTCWAQATFRHVFACTARTWAGSWASIRPCCRFLSPLSVMLTPELHPDPPAGTIIVADTNNGLIRQFDPRTQRLTTLSLANVPPPRRSPDGPPAGAAATAEPPPGAALVRAPDAVAAGSGELQLAIRLPKGYHLTPGANSRFEAALIGGSGEKVQLQPAAGNLAEDASGTTATATVKFSRQGGTGGDGTALLRVLAKVYFCQDRDVCLFQEICFDVPLAPAVQAGQPAAVVPLQFALSASAPVVQLPGL